MSMIDALSLSNLFDKSDFSQTDAIIVAVSGGGDSLALLFLLYHYMIDSGLKKRLIAITIDHGLRLESAYEADYVSRLCAHFGICHETLSWVNRNPKGGLSYQARLARYGLLCQAAEKYQAGVIVTGHMLEDQAETYLMRFCRGSKRGLAVMPRWSLLQNKFLLLRPLLEVRRVTLRNYLNKLQIQWLEDPTNENQKYERARIRKQLDATRVMRLSQHIVKAALQRCKDSDSMTAYAKHYHLSLQNELCMMDLPDILVQGSVINPLTSLIALSAAIMGGAQYPSSNFAQLQAFVQKGHASQATMTLSGSVIQIRKQKLKIWREQRNIASLQIAAGQTVLWDGRYRIHNQSNKIIEIRTPQSAELALWKGQHIASLRSGCMINFEHHSFLFPFDSAAIEAHNIYLERVLLPFDWIVSCYDWTIFRYFQSIFLPKEQKIVQNIDNFQDSFCKSLERDMKNHMLHENHMLH